MMKTYSYREKRSGVAESTATEIAEPQRGAARRKNVRIDQRKLTRVKDLLGASSETEAIDQALDLVLFRREVQDGLRRVAGTGVVRDIHARRT